MMIGELPERFKGTPRDFLEQAYFLAQYKNPYGVFRMQYPQVSEASAKFSIGEHGWALAQRLPDGGCTITVGVEGKDEVMWQRLYAHLKQRGWLKPQPLTMQGQSPAPSDTPKMTKWTTDQIALETYKATVKMLRANYVSIILAILVIIVAILGLPFLQGTIQHFLYGATPTLTPTLVSPTATP